MDYDENSKGMPTVTAMQVMNKYAPNFSIKLQTS